MYTTDTQQCPTYSLEVSDIHLRLGTTLPTPEYPIITKVVDTPVAPFPEVILLDINPPTHISSRTIDHTTMNPPFPHRINKEKSIPQKEETFDIIEQLKNLHIQFLYFKLSKMSLFMERILRKHVLRSQSGKRKILKQSMLSGN